MNKLRLWIEAELARARAELIQARQHKENPLKIRGLIARADALKDVLSQMEN